VYVACGIDVWASLMDSRVNDETSRIDESVCPTNTIALLIYLDHIRDSEKCKVNTIRVDPKRIWLYRVCTRLVRIKAIDKKGAPRTLM
jgi:hypothetical protein